MTNEEAVNVLEDIKVKIVIPKAAELQRKRNEAIDMAIEALNNSEISNSSDSVPPAQPKRPKGKWKPISDGYIDIYECDCCGNTEDYERNFCPNCGADMRGEEDERFD